jgi:TrpR family trp operon transcriptional repressor
MHRNIPEHGLAGGRPCDDAIAAVFTGISDVKVMRRFFSEMFTPAERKDIGLRWRLMIMLSQGVPQRAIAAQLRVSLCKITRGAKVLKSRQSVSRQLLSDPAFKSPGQEEKSHP